MEQTYETPQDQLDLLFEKGYLSENFKTGTKVGYWLKEFTEEYERNRADALIDGQERRFTMSIAGKFNGDLETVHFLFRYKYNPATDTLSLSSVQGRLGKEHEVFYLSKEGDLPTPDAIYQYLRNPESKENDVTMFIRLHLKYLKDRDPANDHKEEQERDRHFRVRL